MQSWFSSAVILIALFAGFIGLVFWAWSKKQKPRFEAASRLPLEDDYAVVNEIKKTENQKVENQGVAKQAEVRISSELSSKKMNTPNGSNNHNNKDI